MSTATVHNVIPAGYILKPEAMQRFGRSLKIFERAVAAAQLETIFVKHERSRPTPAYRSTDIDKLIEERDKPKAIAVRPAAAVARLDPLRTDPLLLAAAAAAAAPEDTKKTRRVPTHEKHLVTLSEATALGYPEDLLREWKKGDNPPGIWTGANKTTFRFSVPALRAIVERLI